MCTYIVHHDNTSATPLIVATTREDAPQRPTSKPFLWDKPEYFAKYTRQGTLHLNFAEGDNVGRYIDAGITASQDEKHGGTFLGTNKHGVFVAVNNRENNVKFTNRRSRGGIVLDGLTFASAKEAAETLYPIVVSTQETADKKYPCFNLIIADDKDAYVITNARKGDLTASDSTVLNHQDAGDFSVALAKIHERTVSFIGGYDINDMPKSVRTQKFRPIYDAMPLPQAGNAASWGGWLSHMVHRTQDGDPFEYSIAQPNPKSPESIGKGDPDWITIGTNLLTASKTNTGMNYDWIAMDTPPREGRMQALKVTPEGNTPIELFMHGAELSIKPLRGSPPKSALG